MDDYQGILGYRLNHVGTRSEGMYAFLVTDEGRELPLCREGAAPFNDTFFEQFDGQRVRISATVDHGWLVVDSVETVGKEHDEEREEKPESETAPEPEDTDEAPDIVADCENDNTQQL